MNKKFLKVVVALMVFGGVILLGVKWLTPAAPDSWRPTTEDYWKFAKEHHLDAVDRLGDAVAGTNLLKPMEPGRRVRLAIGWLGLPTESDNSGAADMVMAKLSEARNLEFVDRQSLNVVLSEAAMNLSGMVRASNAVRVGKLLRADWFLLGSAATINGSNCLVVRIVDAGSGQIWDIKEVPRSKNLAEVSDALADFVRACRDGASHPQSHAYLAIGAVQNVSLGRQQELFANDLRAQLMAAFRQDKRLSVLEREQVEILLQELRLDLAGLTDEGSAHGRAAMQSAFWMVEGVYEATGKEGDEVELDLTLRQLFNNGWERTLKGKPGDAFTQEVKKWIDDVVAKAPPFVRVPTRAAEINNQLLSARELAGIPSYAFDTLDRHAPNFWSSDFFSSRRRQQKMGEAIRAYRTVLVLDPGNHEAKVSLAVCLMEATAAENEARDFLLEVAHSEPVDRWKSRAMALLAWTASNPAETVAWFKEAEILTTNAEFGHRAHDVAAHAGLIVDPENTPEGRLFKKLEGTRDALKSRSGDWPGLYSFVTDYGKGREAGYKRLAELAPEVKAGFPELEPYFVAEMFPEQSETNNPYAMDLERVVNKAAEAPGQVLWVARLLDEVDIYCYKWCFQNKQFTLAKRLMEARQRAVEAQSKEPAYATPFNPAKWTTEANQIKAKLDANKLSFTRADKVRLAYANMKCGLWQEALALAESLPPAPIDPIEFDFRGPEDGVVLPNEMAALCRRKLGLETSKDPKSFELGKVCLNLGAGSTFDCEGGSIWVAVNSRLLELDQNLQTNRVIHIAFPGDYPTALRASAAKVFVGTDKSGLVEYDRATGRITTWHESDGLLSESVQAMALEGDSLWIASGEYSGGLMRPGRGLQRLDLKTHKLSTYTAPMSARSDTANGPPITGICSLAAGNPGEVLVLSVPTYSMPQIAGCLKRYRIDGDEWETLLPNCWTDDGRFNIAWSPGQILVGQRDGVAVKTGSADWRKSASNWGLPQTPTTVALNGADLWVGGPSYVAILDAEKLVVRKVCYVHWPVTEMEFSGGVAWIKLTGNLIYRLPLAELKD